MYISTCAVDTAGFKETQRCLVCPSGGSLHSLPDEWALGSSGCGVTLGCERLFSSLMEDFDLPDQNQTSKKVRGQRV